MLILATMLMHDTIDTDVAVAEPAEPAGSLVGFSKLETCLVVSIPRHVPVRWKEGGSWTEQGGHDS